MAITARDDASATAWTTGTVSATINVQEGDLIVVTVGCPASVNCQYCNGVTDTIGNTYTVRTRVEGDRGNVVTAYVLSSSGTNANNEITASFNDATEGRKNIIVASFAIDSGDEVTLEASNSKASGYEASPWETNPISTTGTDELVIATFQSMAGATTYSDHEIDEIAATVIAGAETAHTLFYRILTGSMTDGEGVVTSSGSQRYVAEILGFKSEAVGGETHQLSGSIAAVSTLSAGMRADLALASSIPGTSVVNAQLVRTRGLLSTIEALSSVSPFLGRRRPFSATIGAVSALTASLREIIKIAASINAVSSVDSALSRTRGLSSTIEAGSTVGGSLSLKRGLQATIGAVSSVSATLSLLGTVSLQASISAVSTVAGTIKKTVPLQATISAVSSVAASIGKYVSLGATIATQSFLTAILKKQGEKEGGAMWPWWMRR